MIEQDESKSERLEARSPQMQDASEVTPAVQPEKLPPLWRNRDFMLLWSGQTVSAIGSGVSGIVFPLLILAITGSTTAAGIAGALASIPYLIFSLPVGALIDRWNRKRVMILCDAGRALTLGSIPVALAFNMLTLWQIYVAAFLEGTFYVLFNIAEVAALPRVVPKQQLPQAAAQNEVAFGASALIGPPLGGFLYQSVSRMAPFVVDAVSYAASVVSLFFIKTEFQGERTTTERNLRAEIMEGVSWLWHHPLIRFMAFLTGGFNLVNAASLLILIVLAKNLGADATQIGTLFSIGSIGGIFGSIIGGQIQKRFSFGQVIVAVAWAETLLFPLFVVAPNIFLLGAILAGLFMLNPIYNVTQFSYRLALIPDHLQGRVNSSFRLLAYGFQPIGAALSGILLDHIGVVPTVLVFATWFVVLAVLTTLNSYVRNAPRIEEAQAG